MKKFITYVSMMLCLMMGVVACTSDDSEVKADTKESIDNGSTVAVTTGNLMGKWRIVKTIEYDVTNAIVKQEVQSNGDCSTLTAYFLEKDKVLFNTYVNKDGVCEIASEEHDGRWVVEGSDVNISEDWRTTEQQRKAKRFSVLKLTSTDLEISYDLKQGDVTGVVPANSTAKITFIFEKVKR